MTPDAQAAFERWWAKKAEMLPGGPDAYRTYNGISKAAVASIWHDGRVSLVDASDDILPVLVRDMLAAAHKAVMTSTSQERAIRNVIVAYGLRLVVDATTKEPS
jgi:hypothetical protein